jgi:hypothetical protein
MIEKPKEAELKEEALPARRIVVELSNANFPQVTFEGDYVNKRELDLVERAIKRAHKEMIRKYREERIINAYKENQNAN